MATRAVAAAPTPPRTFDNERGGAPPLLVGARPDDRGVHPRVRDPGAALAGISGLRLLPRQQHRPQLPPRQRHVVRCDRRPVCLQHRDRRGAVVPRRAPPQNGERVRKLGLGGERCPLRCVPRAHAVGDAVNRARRPDPRLPDEALPVHLARHHRAQRPERGHPACGRRHRLVTGTVPRSTGADGRPSRRQFGDRCADSVALAALVDPPHLTGDEVGVAFALLVDDAALATGEVTDDVVTADLDVEADESAVVVDPVGHQVRHPRDPLRPVVVGAGDAHGARQAAVPMHSLGRFRNTEVVGDAERRMRVVHGERAGVGLDVQATPSEVEGDEAGHRHPPPDNGGHTISRHAVCQVDTLSCDSRTFTTLASDTHVSHLHWLCH